jgi:error-prone DNA polymerase
MCTGNKTGNAIAESREVDGPFASEYDLQRHVPSNTEGRANAAGKDGSVQLDGRETSTAAPRFGVRNAPGRVSGHSSQTFQMSMNWRPQQPLLPMTTEERLVADFGGMGLTMGQHLMSYHRADMNRAGVTPAADLRRKPDGIYMRIYPMGNLVAWHSQSRRTELFSSVIILRL